MPPLNPRAPVKAGSPEDVLVETIPVFFSPELASKMSLVAYPLQSAASQSPLELESVRLKKDNALLEMDMAFPSDEQHLDAPKIERWKDLDALTFKSTTVIPVCHYAVAKMQVDKTSKARELHFVPLAATYQMRPTFPFIEKEDQENGDSEAPQQRQVEQPVEPTGPQGVPSGDGIRAIQYKKKESERTTSAKKNSYAFKRSEESKEAWMDLNVQSMGTSHALRYATLLPCKDKDNVLKFKDEEYVGSLNYLNEVQEKKMLENEEQFDGPQETIATSEQAVNKVVRSFYERNTPINTAVLLSSVKTTSPDILLSAMLKCAWVVRGNWVLKSQYSPFPKATKTARDVCLILLIDMVTLDKNLLKEVLSGLGIGNDLLNHMLKEFACVEGRQWKMKLDDDEVFGTEYPEVCVASDAGLEEIRNEVAPYVDAYKEMKQEPEREIAL